MEAKIRIHVSWLGMTIIPLFFGLFLAAQAQAQILGLGAPVFTVQPVGVTVQNGDTVTLTASAYCNLGSICSVTWVFSNGRNGRLPDNATVANVGLGSANVSTTLTLKHVSAACAGTYYVEIEDELLGGLLGLTTATSYSQKASVAVTPTVIGTADGSQMDTKGFTIEFSGPTGSNLVIQASSDMKHWTPVYTNRISGGTVTYTDPMARTVSGRWYRAKLQ
ncbi:MAG: immunoglobulin domain-containing protein [Limisphaerales bacterium]